MNASTRCVKVDMKSKVMKENRCKKCSKLLMKADLLAGKVEILCQRCKTLNVYEVSMSQSVFYPKEGTNIA